MFRVLIADNDMPMCSALSSMLDDMEDVEVVDTARTGEDAVKICKESGVDIVFMDSLLSGMHGVEAGEKIYKKCPDTAVYLMTTFSRTLDLKDYMQDMVSGFIEKPFGISEVNRIFDNYRKEHEGKVSHQLEYLNTVIQKKDYSEMYYNIHKVVDSIYEASFNDVVKVAQELRSVGRGLCDSIRFYESEREDIEDKFPLNDVLISDRKVAELWLSQVVDHIFQQNGINRYPLLENVFTYINNNIKKDINLNKIVEACAISQGYLSRIFKSQFQISVMDYLHMRKMILAKGYFCFTEYSIAEIAFKLGYSESSYFSKVFKKYEHMTGKEYRSSLLRV